MKNKIILALILSLVATAPQILAMKKNDIFKAIEENKIEEVKDILKNDKEKINEEKNDKTPLHFATMRGCIEIVKLILNQGANVDAKNNDGSTALYFAGKYGRSEITELLLEKGAEINAKNNVGDTALHIAAVNGHEEVVESLLDKGADLCRKNNNNKTPIDYAFGEGNNSIKIDSILGQGALDLLLTEFEKNNDEQKDMVKKMVAYISGEKTPTYPKIKAIEKLIKVCKRDNSLVSESQIKEYIKKIPFNFDSLSSSTILAFVFSHTNVVDINKRNVQEALCIYPTCEAIPFIFSTMGPKKEFIKELLKQAKVLNKKEFARNLLKAMEIPFLLYETDKLPFPPEIVGKIMSFNFQ